MGRSGGRPFSIRGIANEYKGSEVGKILVCLRNRKKVSVARTELREQASGGR